MTSWIRDGEKRDKYQNKINNTMKVAIKMKNSS